MSTGNTEHTPLPWHCDGIDGTLIAVGNGPLQREWVAQTYELAKHPGTPQANARLIVAAVNNHEALLSACRDVLEALDNRYDGASDSRTLWMGRHIAALSVAIDAAVVAGREGARL